MYLAPIISQHLDIVHQLQCLGIVFLFSCHGIRGLCSKSGIDHKFCAYVISVMIVAFARALSSEVEIFGI